MRGIKYTVGSEWDAGFVGNMAVTSDTALQDWTVAFDASFSIYNLWDAEIVSHVGDHYVVGNVGSDATVPAGGQVSFGFQATPGSGGTAASGFIINGAAADQSGMAPLSIAAAAMTTGNGALSGTFTAGDVWNTGFSGVVDVENGGSAVTSWQIELDMPYQITNLWNATIISHDSTGYVIGNVDTNGTLAGNGDVAFGFTAQGPFDPSSIYVHGIGQPVTSIPTVPTQLTDVETTSSSVLLGWVPSTVAGNAPGTVYAIFENGQQIATTTDLRYTVSGLTADTTYQFAVSASSAAGTSGMSSPLSVQTAAVGSDTGAATTFSPYVDMSRWQDTNVAAMALESGTKNFTLGFIVSRGQGIGWGGQTGGITQDVVHDGGGTILDQVQKIQKAGGNVTISFGGEQGQEPAQTAPNLATLVSEYQSVIDRYHVTSLDFDIEGADESDQTAMALRDKALVKLEAANPGLKVSFTLPVTTTGLDATGLNVLQTAKQDGVRVDMVNIMAMVFGPAYPGPTGQYAVSAAKGTETELTTLGLGAKLGITPLVGTHANETFQPADAQLLLAYAASDPNVAQLAMWSAARDRGHFDPPDSGGGSWTPWQISKIFNTFDKS